ncbi:glycosyltransferase family 2 protein [Aquirufa sp. HETE-83D]|uniref:Glycosyltransferase family 2 protein n=1 Tax=Aquirufa esocilacus TaxID=3096513 RepID=A0ABW6DPG0_9BACT
MEVYALIVLYNPDFDSCLSNLYSIRNQVSKVIVIDNSQCEIDKDNFDGIIDFYYFNNNVGGIAQAQNLGIEYALSDGADFILLLDQDSFSSPEMVSILIRDFFKVRNSGFNIAAIGPQAINAESGIPYAPRFRKFSHFDLDSNVLFCNELISSGTLIDISVFKTVGTMNDILFIDGVDHEWCWRAKSYNYILSLTKNASLFHSLGEGDKSFFGIRISISSPFRIYFQYRNFIYLCFQNHVPFYWKVNNFIKYFVKYFYYPIFVSKHYFARINVGIIDGFKLLFLR